MALFHASGSSRNDTGKFRSVKRPGVQTAGSQKCGKYRFEMMVMESRGPIVRTRYHVRIFNERNIRVAFLRDFSTAARAIDAAKDWVAERIESGRNGR